MYLVVLETGGNQRYIFQSNRLRENIGASELTYRGGTEYVLRAVHNAGGADFSEVLGNPAGVRQKILDQNPGGTNGIEVIVATSGKAMLLVEDVSKAKKIVRQATATALKEAPGLDLCGVVWEVAGDNFGQTVRNAHQKLQEIQSQRTGCSTRYPQLPVVAECQSTGGPAFGMTDEALRTQDDRRKPEVTSVWRDVSRSSFVKGEYFGKWQVDDEASRHQRRGWRDRLENICANKLQFAPNPHRLEKDANLDWLGVVHIDGNGLGLIFLNFENFLPDGKRDYRTYVNLFRKFSCALEEAAETAFCRTLEGDDSWTPKLHDRGKNPFPAFIPLILGGDDVTLVCDGREALPFTIRFLRNFEEETGKRQDVAEIIRAATGERESAVTASAGVAIVKPHFPFHRAYHLAEQLINSAKRPIKALFELGQPRCSSIDFHILYDASYTDLQSIRKRLVAPDGCLLTTKPYVLLDDDRPHDNDWVNAANWMGLDKRVEALNSTTDGRRLLSSSQMHALREALHEGTKEADNQLALVSHRLSASQYNVLREDQSDTLVRDRTPYPGETSSSSSETTPRKETRFLDALDVAAFWGVTSGDDQPGSDS
ncbi:MAG: hypothetical protein R3C18_04545 [Planctomycetaceae bacterium]